MDISTIDYSKLPLVGSRGRIARRDASRTATSTKHEEVAPVNRRMDEGTSKKMDAFAKVQQVFMFAKRLGEDIQQQGILEPIV